MDDSNGLCHARARYFSPTLGRFISQDPIWGTDSSSQSFHRYVYALNNPLAFFDPSGLSPGDSASGSFGSDFLSALGHSSAQAGLGIWDAAKGLVTGIPKAGVAIVYGLVHSGDFIYAVVDDPGEVASAVWSEVVVASLKNTVSAFGNDPRKFSEIAASLALPIAGSKVVKLIPVAAESGVLADANFAQRTFSQAFSSEGAFSGQTVTDVAAALRSGEMRAANVPIEYIVRDGNTLMLNTRSAQALEQAGIPRTQWNAVNVTGDAAAEARLTGQLQRNGLTSKGTPVVTPSGH